MCRCLYVGDLCWNGVYFDLIIELADRGKCGECVGRGEEPCVVVICCGDHAVVFLLFVIYCFSPRY